MMCNKLLFDADGGIQLRVTRGAFEGLLDDEVIESLEDLVEAEKTALVVSGDYQTIYCIAHEMDRLKEILRATAMHMEDSTLVLADFYDVDAEDIADVH